MEVILVDDASGDDTLTLLRTLEQQYPDWVKIIALNENKGAAFARNAGWDLASQPYVAFLDADDSWHPAKLSIQYQYMLKNPAISLCGHQTIWLNTVAPVPSLAGIALTTKISPISLLYKNAFSTPSVMLKRDIPFRFQSGKRYAEDLLLWQEIAFAGLSVVRIENPLAYVYKPFYGLTGLSANLWEMEREELNNFEELFKLKRIGIIHYAIAKCYSVAKFIRRLILIKIYTSKP
jgi:glycosyltransferase involved in cell wall biosynthesis